MVKQLTGLAGKLILKASSHQSALINCTRCSVLALHSLLLAGELEGTLKVIESNSNHSMISSVLLPSIQSHCVKLVCSGEKCTLKHFQSVTTLLIAGKVGISLLTSPFRNAKVCVKKASQRHSWAVSKMIT